MIESKTLSVEEYHNKIRQFLKDINYLKKSDTWKIQLTIAIEFMSSKDHDKECVMHSKSDNIEIMINDKADDVLKELFQSLLCQYQTGLDTSIEAMFLYLIVFIYYIIDVIKYILNAADHIKILLIG